MRRGAPRVGDGVIHLDPDGVVRYASPNAVSAVHRTGHVGNVMGEVLAQVVADIAARGGSTVDESLAVVAMGRAAWPRLETASATITLRAIPLTPWAGCAPGRWCSFATSPEPAPPGAGSLLTGRRDHP